MVPRHSSLRDDNRYSHFYSFHAMPLSVTSTCSAVCTGRHPFKDYATIQKGGSRSTAHLNTLRNIANKHVKPKFYTMSSNVQRLAEGLLDKNANTRLGVEQGGGDGRQGVESVKAHPYFSDLNWEEVYSRKAPSPAWAAQIWKNEVRCCAF